MKTPKATGLDPIWAMRPASFQRRLEYVRAHFSPSAVQAFMDRPDPKAAAELAGDGESDEPTYRIEDGAAVIQINGVISKYATPCGRVFGDEAATTVLIDLVRAATADVDVHSIALVIDSPGGSVAGTADLADAIYAARQVKPVIGFAWDLVGSAAYWLISQCTKVYLNNATCIIGSIGTYAVITDWSKAVAAEGGVVHVVRAGAGKGAGIPGTEVTDTQLADFQRVVNDLNEGFLAGVARGRGMPLDKVRELADGREHVGEKAVALGLADAIKPFENILAELSANHVNNQAQAAAKSGALQMAEVPDPMYKVGDQVTIVDPDDDDNGAAAEITACQPMNGYQVKTADGEVLDWYAEDELGKASGAAAKGGSLARVAALKAAHPGHAELIIDLVSAGKSNLEVKAAIAGVEQKAAVDKTAALEAENARLKASAGPTPAGLAGKAAPAVAGKPGDFLAMTQEQFEADPKLVAEFSNVKVYNAFMTREAQGRIIVV